MTATSDDSCKCLEFKLAQEPCTDNEGYSCLIQFYGGEWKIGSGLDPIAFCPWCGKQVAPPEESQTYV